MNARRLVVLDFREIICTQLANALSKVGRSEVIVPRSSSRNHLPRMQMNSGAFCPLSSRPRQQLTRLVLFIPASFIPASFIDAQHHAGRTG
jgi:hypothetical protein